MLSGFIFSESHLCFFLDITGGILKPTLAGSCQLSHQQPEKLVSDDLDSSLANLVGSTFYAIFWAELL